MLKLLLSLILVVLSTSFHIQTISDGISDVESRISIPWPFSVCGAGRWTIDSLTMSILPARNTNNDIDVVGTANQAVAFKSVALMVKLNNVFLHSETVDFLKKYDEGDTVEFRYKNYIPQFAPTGTYSITFTWINDKGANEGCILITFKL